MTDRWQLGVVLAQMGGPDSPEAVGPFLRALFEDPAMVATPGGPRTRAALARLVSSTRARSARARYRAIGGGSPIGAVTRTQAERLAAELERRGHTAIVRVAMRYTEPSTEAAVREVLASGVDHLVLLPLYPQRCAATTGSATTELERVLDGLADPPPVSVVGSWSEDPTYLALGAELLRSALDELDHLDELARAGAVVVFSAHGIPQRLADTGDPYPGEVATTVRGIMRHLDEDVPHLISFQSRVGPVRWLGPDTVTTVGALGAAGCRAVVVVPVSFVSDHIETLGELDLELAEVARRAGITHFVRAPVVGDRPAVGPLLADLCERHLAELDATRPRRRDAVPTPGGPLGER